MIITPQTITRYRAVVQTGWTRKDREILDNMDTWCGNTVGHYNYDVNESGDISTVRTYSFRTAEARDAFVLEFAHTVDGIRGDEDDGRSFYDPDDEEDAA